MDTLRGTYGSFDTDEPDLADEDFEREPPPAAIGQDERRLQVRAYNHWASLLGERKFPAIEDLDPAGLPDIGPNSVLLDFTAGIENPGVAFLGEELARECDADAGGIETLADVPGRSLLSRITDHYMQILANQAPIGFEAEFVNQRGIAILYRGILLPYSSDDETIDFIFGVINWKELADQQAADELLLEIEQALEPIAPRAREDEPAEPLPDWADGPGAPGEAAAEPQPAGRAAELTPLSAALRSFETTLKRPVLLPSDEALEDAVAGLDFTAPSGPLPLADWLAAAREMAERARTSEDRTRQALYQAISQAYDFSLAAAAAPAEFAALLAEAGLTAQERAPLTPVVKLVFGAGYDKTRLTEYAAALSLAHRLEMPIGSLGDYLAEAEGGLKAVVAAERRLRREEQGKPARAAPAAPRPAITRKLRALPAQDFAGIAPEGDEFALVMIRRGGDGEIAVLGEVPADVALIERAARHLIG